MQEEAEAKVEGKEDGVDDEVLRQMKPMLQGKY
jgi:hypothetical protein